MVFLISLSFSPEFELQVAADSLFHNGPAEFCHRPLLTYMSAVALCVYLHVVIVGGNISICVNKY